MLEAPDPDLRSMPSDLIEDVRAIAENHDPDVVSILILHGSPARGIAASHWTAFEGPDSEERGLGLIFDAVLQMKDQADAE